MGPELIRSCLYDKLRDAQKEELDRLMADAPAGRPQPERLTRKEAAKQAAKQAAAEAAAGAGAGDGEAAAAANGGGAVGAEAVEEAVGGGGGSGMKGARVSVHSCLALPPCRTQPPADDKPASCYSSQILAGDGGLV